MHIDILCADVLDWAAETEPTKAHAILCDPSYALSKKKRLDMGALIGAEIKTVGDVIAAYHSLQQWGDVGFMNRQWDNDVAFNPETWRLLAKHLLPGGFIMAFASTRGDHRMATAMEDAGLIIHPKIIWLNSQAFPKSTRVDVQIEKRRNDLKDVLKVTRWLNEQIKESEWTHAQLLRAFGFNEGSGQIGHWTAMSEGAQPAIPSWEQWQGLRELVGLNDDMDVIVKRLNKRKGQPGEAWFRRVVVGRGFDSGNRQVEGGMLTVGEKEWDVTIPATDLARAWQGHRYGRQALKNCAEVIIVAQKPYDGRPVDSIVATGAGALWIDGGRVGVEGNRPFRKSENHGLNRSVYVGGAAHQGGSKAIGVTTQGRWPPNFCLSHIPSHYFCPSCHIAHPMQPVIEVCPDCGGELEWVEGCKRVGVKRVDAGHWGQPTIGKGQASWNEKTCGLRNWEKEGQSCGYADHDGLETVSDWACTRGCAVAELGEQSGELHRGWTQGKGQTPVYGSGEGITLNPSKTMDSGKYRGYSDKGTCTRYYPQVGWEAEQAEMACVPDCPVKKLDESTDGQRCHKPNTGSEYSERVGSGMFWENSPGPVLNRIQDTGPVSGPSRFYPQADFSHEIAEQIATASPARYQPKSPKRERNSGLDDFYWRRDKSSPSGFVRVSREEWEALGKRERARGNIHSTVKPIKLLEWLCCLLAPPIEYAPRRLLIPFSGSGSEICAAVISGCWEGIAAVEFIQDYVDISEARVQFYAGEGRQLELCL